MICPNCNKTIPDDSTFCNHCGKQTKEKEPSVMRALMIPVAGLFIIIALTFCGICFWPLDNEKRAYEASKGAHDALKALNSYTGANDECSKTCAICHPLTWRLHVRFR